MQNRVLVDESVAEPFKEANMVIFIISVLSGKYRESTIRQMPSSFKERDRHFQTSCEH